jgi:hypothetical protein
VCATGRVLVLTVVMVGGGGGRWTWAPSKAVLEADAPRVSWRRHGVVVAAVPWACYGAGYQGSGHGVYSVVALSRLACMFVAGGVVFVPIVRYN